MYYRNTKSKVTPVQIHVNSNESLLQYGTGRVHKCLNSRFYPRDAMLARVFATATCPSVRLSGRPSVTRRYCA